MNGLSTRFAFKTLSKVFNFDHWRWPPTRCTCSMCWKTRSSRSSSPARPTTATSTLSRSSWPTTTSSLSARRSRPPTWSPIPSTARTCFDRYVTYADFWIQDQEYRDPETGEILDRAAMNDELEKIEKPAGISNPKDFRSEIVNFVLRARANNQGKNPAWTSYEKLRSCHREEDVRQHRRPAAGYLLQCQSIRRRSSRNIRTLSSVWWSGVTPRSRCACCPNGICGSGSRSNDTYAGRTTDL